jgi:hypothetical protein
MSALFCHFTLYRFAVCFYNHGDTESKEKTE